MVYYGGATITGSLISVTGVEHTAIGVTTVCRGNSCKSTTIEEAIPSTSSVLIVLTIRLQNNRNTVTNLRAVAALHIDYNSKRDMLYKQPQHTS